MPTKPQLSENPGAIRKREQRHQRSAKTRRCAMPDCRVVMWTPAKVCGPCAAGLRAAGLWVCTDPGHGGRRVIGVEHFRRDRSGLYGFRMQCRDCYNRTAKMLRRGRHGGTQAKVRARQLREELEAQEQEQEQGRHAYHDWAVRMLIRSGRRYDGSRSW